MDISLQIVCFNVPFPANYGGAIDVFFKIKALHKAGVRLILHCFTYDQYQPAIELEAYCDQLYYYKRKGDIKTHLSSLPFIINSRKDQLLLERLKSCPAPILFEGTHTTGFLNHEDLKDHFKLIRMHNVESAYYKKLSHWETNPLKRLYLKKESSRLANFEEGLYYTNAVFLAISAFDHLYYGTNHRGDCHLIRPFHPFDDVVSLPGTGDYIFIHADFNISENVVWVTELVNGIVNHVTLDIRIAGKNANRLDAIKAINAGNIHIESTVSQERMFELLQNAQMTIVQSLNSEGFKLKLLYSLYLGRHCVANEMILRGTDLENLCHQAETTEEILEQIQLLEKKTFDLADIDQRRNALEAKFSNAINAEKIRSLLPEHDKKAI